MLVALCSFSGVIAASPIELTIDDKHVAAFSTAPRIISAGGSITEVMYALDLEENLIAIDSSSLYPPNAQKLPSVGYFRRLGSEGLMSLNPNLLVAARGAGPDQVLEQIKELGVEVKLFTQSTYTLASWKMLITEIGNYFGRQEKAQELVKQVTKKLASLSYGRQYEDRGLNAIALLSLGQRGPMAAGKNTVPDLLLELAGINNLASSLDGYKPFSTELFAKSKLDLILVPSHIAESLGGKDAICATVLVQLAMPEQCNVHIMDGLLLMGFGARIDQAVEEVINQANQLRSPT